MLPVSCNAFCGASAGVHPERLYRILRFAVNHHCLAVVRSVGGGPPRFRNTATSSLLREDHPNSLKAIVRPCIATLCAQADIKPSLHTLNTSQSSVVFEFTRSCLQTGHNPGDPWSA